MEICKFVEAHPPPTHKGSFIIPLASLFIGLRKIVVVDLHFCSMEKVYKKLDCLRVFEICTKARDHVVSVTPHGQSVKLVLARCLDAGCLPSVARGGLERRAENSLLVQVGLVLAVMNTIMWSYNCFVFLLLRVMPNYVNQDKYPVPRIAWWGQLVPVLPSSGKKVD